MPDVEQELDRLYGLPLDEFTAARNELAKRLRNASDPESAERVAALRKPPVTAWAVNQAAREAPGKMAALNEAGRELFDAQREGLGGGDTGGFEGAQRRQRDAVRAVVQAARSILDRAGRSSSDATLERIAATLRSASVEEEGRQLLFAGRLEDDFEGSGMFLLAGLAPSKPRPARATKAESRAPQRAEQLREARARVREAKDAERALDRVARQAERAADKAQAEAVRLADEARAARAEADRAAEAVEQAARALAE